MTGKSRSLRLIALMLAVLLVVSIAPVAGFAQAQEERAAASMTDKQDKFYRVAKNYADNGTSRTEFVGGSGAWCTLYVLRCAEKAGLIKSKDFPSYSATAPVIGYSNLEVTYVRGMVAWFTENNKGTYYYFDNRTYGVHDKKNRVVKADRNKFVPQKGDLIVYYWPSDRDNILSHIGIVAGYNTASKQVDAFEGNTLDGMRVYKRSMEKADERWGYIAGYVRPDCFAGSVTPSVEFASVGVPDGLGTGKTGHLTGTISEPSQTCKLTSVAATVINSKGETKLSGSDKPNAYFYTLKDSKLDKALAFEKLPAGTYTLQLSASTSNSKVKGSKKVTFKIVDSKKVKIEFVSVAGPGTLQQGQGNHITGTIKATNSKIASIQGDVKNSSGKIVLTKTVKPNSSSYKLKDSELDNALTFGVLGAGDYTLTYTVKTAAGTSGTKSVKFKVKGASSYTAIVTPNAGLNLRSGPGTNYAIVAAVPQGTKLTVLSVSNGWAKIKYKNQTVYAAAEYLKRA